MELVLVNHRIVHMDSDWLLNHYWRSVDTTSLVSCVPTTTATVSLSLPIYLQVKDEIMMKMMIGWWCPDLVTVIIISHINATYKIPHCNIITDNTVLSWTTTQKDRSVKLLCSRTERIT